MFSHFRFCGSFADTFCGKWVRILRAFLQLLPSSNTYIIVCCDFDNEPIKTVFTGNRWIFCSWGSGESLRTTYFLRNWRKYLVNDAEETARCQICNLKSKRCHSWLAVGAWTESLLWQFVPWGKQIYHSQLFHIIHSTSKDLKILHLYSTFGNFGRASCLRYVFFTKVQLQLNFPWFAC